MADMMTNQERLEIVEQKLDDLLEIVRPKEAKAEADPNQMLMDEIVAISNEMDLLIDEVKSVRKDVQIAIKQPFEVAEELSEADKKFNTRRNIFVLGGLVVTGALSLTFWLYFLPLFAVTIGVFFSFGMLALLLAKDEFVLPGNTIKRIAQNAIAAAIFILAFVVIISTGIQVGNSLISDRSQSEEYRQPTATERQAESRTEPSIGESEE